MKTTLILITLIFSFTHLHAQLSSADRKEVRSISQDELSKEKLDVSNRIERLKRRIDEINDSLMTYKKNQNVFLANYINLQDSLSQLKDSLIEVQITVLGNQIDLDSIRPKVKANENELKTTVETSTKHKAYINRFWILISAALVFLMQAGFKVFEYGMVRKQHTNGVGMKNLIDWLVVCAVFFLIGFQLMFGESNGLFGWFSWLPNQTDMSVDPEKEMDFGLEFFLFQLAFAATAATIVSGAMSERTALGPYLITSIFVGAIIYPVFGHWVWGNVYWKENDLLLANVFGSGLDFIDFAGSTVVHSIGAWVALAGIIILGPRKNRYNPKVWDMSNEKYRPYSLGMSVLGVFILWFGWWGFNGGSTFGLFDEVDKDVTSIILNTNIAGAFGGLAAFTHAFFKDKKNIYAKLMGGALGGLVAITACCNVVDSTQSIFIGLAAGIIHNLACDFMSIMKWDDPVGAIPVHGACGVFGTLAVSLGTNDSFVDLPQLGIQLFGITVAFVFAFGISFIFFKVLNQFGLRLSPLEEDIGQDLGKGYDPVLRN